MRVLIATRDRALLGGLEVYLRAVLGALAAAHIEVAILAEHDAPRGTEPLDASVQVPVWCVDRSSAESAVKAARQWNPDLVFSHGLEDASLSDRVVAMAPSIYFAHGYHGLCISGERMHKNPAAQTCHRRFGWQCLGHYYPRRCGGLSPITMWRDYSREMRERERLTRFSAILTTSDYVRREFEHLVPAQRLRKVPMLVRKPASVRAIGLDDSRRQRRLLFAGRMTPLKGGDFLLDALPEVARALGAELELTMAGDGPSRETWQLKARRLETDPGIAVRFPGWLSEAQLGQELARTDLLVMPSVWPEPFGLIGAEAARLGIPSAAFDVGGISEWLLDGISGALAPSNPPTAKQLATAILRCLGDGETYLQLARGALESSSRFDPELHLAALLEIFGQVAPNSELERARTA